MLLDEKKEIVLESFKKTLDVTMAYVKANLTPEEISLVEQDKLFQHRLYSLLIDVREKIVSRFYGFMDSDNPKIAFEATKECTKILYQDYFIEPKGVRPPIPEKNSEGKANLTNYSDDDLKRLLDE